MYLANLEISGFKSFAQKTKLKFTDGICCVIGPNGSGKSNIVDAIRWVLGEQKVSTLRTDRMESLIFNGTSVHKPLSLTEVSLTVHNNKNILKSHYSDVVISRRLYRSGESQYMINKTPCRLKDIQDMFMDTGMGADSYSVIELKMVEYIISENPFDRRHLFEEAAGVTRYKNRRKSALRKLDATRQDMSRISDLMAEISHTVNSLSRQVGKARRYLKYVEDLKKNELDLARFRYSRLMDDIQPMQQQLEEISAIKEDTSHQITLEEALLEDYKREIIQIENTLVDFNKQVYDQDQKIHQLKEQEAVAQTRIHAMNETKHRNVQDINEFQLKLNLSQTDLDANQEKLIALQQNLEILQQKYHEKKQDHEREETDLHKKRLHLERINTELRTLQDELLAQKSEAQEKNYKIKLFQEQLNSIESENTKSRKKIAEISQQLDTFERKKDEITKESSLKLSKITSLQNSMQQIEQEILNKKEVLQQHTVQIDAIKSRIEFFTQIISNYEGHTQGTRYIMTSNQNFPGLHGPLSDLINVDDDHKGAVEAALGDAINFLVVENIQAAKEIIEKVTKENQGRVTILPLDRLNQISVPHEMPQIHLPLLSTLVDCDPQYDKIFALLLGDVALTDNLDHALEESVKYPNLRYATQNGELVNAQSIVTGGGKPDSRAALIGRREQLKRLNQDLKDLENTFYLTNNELGKLVDKKKSEQQDLQQYEDDNNTLLSTLSDIERHQAQLVYEKKSLTEADNGRDISSEKINESIKAYQKDLQKVESVISEKQKRIEEHDKNNISVQKFYTEEEQVQVSNRALQDLHLQLVTEQNNCNNCENDIERTRATIAELEQLIEKRKKDNDVINQQLKQINTDIKGQKQKQEKIWETRDNIEVDKEQIQETYHDLKDKILHLENQIKKYRKQHDSSLERSRQLQLNIQENQMKSEAIMQRIKEEYNEDISVGIAYDGLNVEVTEQHIETLKFRIKQLGQVNPLAVSEYEKESERLEFYKKQYEDLEEAEKSLRKTINKINITARKQFLETFKNIKVNFERVFGRFFNAGEGTLKLEEDTDPLESNIEILVRPKGKRVQTINLLSGGEKTLTAISLLFAIYLVKPSPFCILDEIDAPLDDVNISRFTKALKEFSKDTQFIVVTHNKRTMESADTMFGVTMEEEGLSKIVSVKFN